VQQHCRPAAPAQVTQLGHVKDLATAFVKCLGNDKASKQIYNISGASGCCLWWRL
jgi:nucleoside-diphosphate-sugar epimerase